MATFKICVRKQRKDLLYPIYIRITHNRKAGYIKTNKVADKSSIRQDELKNPTLLAYRTELIKDYNNKLPEVDIATWDINEVIRYLQNIDEDISFSKYARKYERDMVVYRGMERNSRNYKWAYLNEKVIKCVFG